MNEDLVWRIVGCTLVTAVPRVFPLMYLSTSSLPPLALRWLSFVPVSVMAALLFPDILLRQGALDISFGNLYLVAAIPALLVAWRSGSFFGTIACAMGGVALLRYLGWGV